MELGLSVARICYRFAGEEKSSVVFYLSRIQGSDARVWNKNQIFPDGVESSEYGLTLRALSAMHRVQALTFVCFVGARVGKRH